MQISKIQNIIRNNFQYKNNPIKFGAINFRGQDTFERTTTDDVVVSKTYHRGKQKYTSDMFLFHKNRVFIKNKDCYTPYGAHLEEYNAKGEKIRHTSFNNGFKYFVDTYKNGELIQEDKYEDIFGHHPSKRTFVRKFNDSNNPETRQNISFTISRNYGKNWEKHPRIEMTKDNLGVRFNFPSDYDKGVISVVDYTNAQTNCIYFDEDTKNEYITNPDFMLVGLQELRATIQSNEFKDDFGFSEKFNSGLNKAIHHLSSKLNED